MRFEVSKRFIRWDKTSPVKYRIYEAYFLYKELKKEGTVFSNYRFKKGYTYSPKMAEKWANKKDVPKRAGFKVIRGTLINGFWGIGIWSRK